MPPAMTHPVRFAPAAFDLLAELATNNDRTWFDAHRSEFRALLHDPMITLLETVSRQLADSPFPLSGGRQTLMRQHRDTRFADTAHHLTVRGLLSGHGGRLAPHEGGAHVELATVPTEQPANGEVIGGVGEARVAVLTHQRVAATGERER